jgi:hypothetical protein
MRARVIKKLEEPKPIVVDVKDLPSEIEEVIPKLVKELNKLRNVMFWPINTDYTFEPFKSSHIMGIKPTKKNVKHAFGENTFTPLDVINQEIISQVVLIDYIPVEGNSLKEKEINYHNLILNNEHYLLKKQRCPMMGIIYIGDYRLARIYEKIKEI